MPAQKAHTWQTFKEVNSTLALGPKWQHKSRVFLILHIAAGTWFLPPREAQGDMAYTEGKFPLVLDLLL